VRTEQLSMNLGATILAKGVSMVAQYALLGVLVRHVGAGDLGIYFALASFAAWFGVLDIGVAHGLRNRVSQSFAQGRLEDAADSLVAGVHLSVVSAVIMLIVGVACERLVGLGWFFNLARPVTNAEIALFYVLLGAAAIRLGAKPYQAVMQGILKGRFVDLSTSLSTILAILVFVAVLPWVDLNVALLGVVLELLPASLSALLTYVLVVKASNLRFRLLGKGSPAARRDVISIGGRFFIVQMLTLVVYASDAYLIAVMRSPEEVTLYQVAYRFFSIILVGIAVLNIPLWPAIAHAIACRDFQWLKRAIIWVLVFAATLMAGVLAFSSFAFELLREAWLGTAVVVPVDLVTHMAWYSVFFVLVSLASVFLNAAEVLRVQFWGYLAIALVKVPALLFVTRALGWDVAGMVLVDAVLLGGLALVFWTVVLRYYRGVAHA